MLTATGVDRFLALLLGLTYRQTVTLVHVFGSIIISWLVLALHSMLYFWYMRIFMIAVSADIVLYIVVSSYITMYPTLRYCKAQVVQLSLNRISLPTFPTVSNDGRLARSRLSVSGDNRRKTRAGDERDQRRT